MPPFYIQFIHQIIIKYERYFIEQGFPRYAIVLATSLGRAKSLLEEALKKDNPHAQINILKTRKSEILILTKEEVVLKGYYSLPVDNS